MDDLQTWRAGTEGWHEAEEAQDAAAGGNGLAFLGDAGSYLEGPAAEIECRRMKTTDNADGTVTICLRIEAKELPGLLASSPDGSLWHLNLPDDEQRRHDLKGVRLALRDAADRKVDLRFQVMTAGTAPCVLWGMTNTSCRVRLSLMAGRHPYPYFVQRAERAACLRRAVMFCTEPAFDDWLLGRCDAQGLPDLALMDADDAIGLDAAMSMRMRAAENLCRLARLQSRREVLWSNAAAERVEALLRAYREHLWTNGAATRREAERSRGLKRGGR